MLLLAVNLSYIRLKHMMYAYRLYSAFSVTEPVRLLNQPMSVPGFSVQVLQVWEAKALGFDFTTP